MKFSPRVTRQLVILSLCRFAEPVALTSVFPYLYYMIKSFGVPTKDVAFYAGITAASFSFAQAFTGVLWGRASDRFGRKPAILLGLVGTLTCLLLFGFSTSLPMAIAARSLSGITNGNVGILRTMVAEMVPEKELQPRAYSIMPLVWNIGSVLGPSLGGALADPLGNHPDWFSGRPAFFVKFPYALPNLVVSSIFLLGIPTGILFLDETLATKRSRVDPGRKLGYRISAFFNKSDARSDEAADERAALLGDEEAEPTPKQQLKDEGPPPLSAAFTFQSTVNIIYYGMLAFHSTTYDQLLPVFMSYPVQDPAEQHGLMFTGGFGMPSSEIGNFLSIVGFLGIFLLLFVYPSVTYRLGTLKCLKIVSFIMPLVYLTLPFLSLMNHRKPLILVWMVLKSVGGTFAFPCSTILLTNSSPSPRVLGTLNGIAVGVAALGRAVGPAIGGMVFSYGEEIGSVVFPWALLAAFALLTAIPPFFMTEGNGLHDDLAKEDIADDRDANEHITKDDGLVNDYGSVAAKGNNSQLRI